MTGCKGLIPKSRRNWTNTLSNQVFRCGKKSKSKRTLVLQETAQLMFDVASNHSQPHRMINSSSSVVDSFAPAHLALRAAYGSLPRGRPAAWLWSPCPLWLILLDSGLDRISRIGKIEGDSEGARLSLGSARRAEPTNKSSVRYLAAAGFGAGLRFACKDCRISVGGFPDTWVKHRVK
jgi:hypothetical protein